MKIKNKFMAYILIGFLSVSSLTTSYVQGVYAIEWVGGAIAFEEALKWILGALGIVVGTKVASDVWQEYGYQFKTFCSDTKDIAVEEVTTFCDKLSRGILDKGSACWQALKEWASTLVSGGGSSATGNINFPANCTISQALDIINNYLGTRFYSDNSLGDLNFDCCIVYTANSGFTNMSRAFFVNGDVFTLFNSNSDSFSLSVDGKTSGISYKYAAMNNDNGKLSSGYGGLTGIYLGNDFTNNYLYYTNNVINDFNGVTFDFESMGFSGSIDSDNDFVAIKKDVADLDIISSLSGDDAEDAEVSIPMPGVSDGDSAESASAYDDIVEGYQDGTVDLPTTIGDIQDITKVIVIDDDTDTVFPTPEGEEPITKEDALDDIKDNMGFTLGGLETVFPFCIPWDIYSFLGLLVADPVAPSFVFPFRDPKTKQDINMTVDLSPFNSAAEVCRYGFDLVFIVGLAMVTRKLIGAGGDS